MSTELVQINAIQSSEGSRNRLNNSCPQKQVIIDTDTISLATQISQKLMDRLEGLEFLPYIFSLFLC